MEVYKSCSTHKIAILNRADTEVIRKRLQIDQQFAPITCCIISIDRNHTIKACFSAQALLKHMQMHLYFKVSVTLRNLLALRNEGN